MLAEEITRQRRHINTVTATHYLQSSQQGQW